MNLQTILKTITLSLFLAGCGSSCNPDTESSDTNNNEPSLVTWDECGYFQDDHMCNIKLTNHDGEEFELYDHIGSPIVIDFSTMWCGYCQVAAGTIPDIASQYEDEGLEFVTILIDDASGLPVDLEDLQIWADIFELQDHYVLGGSREMIDPEGITGPPISSWPSFLFIDRNMVIKSTLRGYSEYYIHDMIQNTILE